MSDHDLFDNPMVRAAAASMSKEDQEKYKKVGELMYSNIDLIANTNFERPELEESTLHICNQLASGMHPSCLDKKEHDVMKDAYGSEWYLKWGYCEKDLYEFFTIKF